MLPDYFEEAGGNDIAGQEAEAGDVPEAGALVEEEEEDSVFILSLGASGLTIAERCLWALLNRTRCS